MASGFCPVAASRIVRWRPGVLPAVQLVSGVNLSPTVAWARRMLSLPVMAPSDVLHLSGRSTMLLARYVKWGDAEATLKGIEVRPEPVANFFQIHIP